MAGYAVDVLHTQSNPKTFALTTRPKIVSDMRTFLTVGFAVLPSLGTFCFSCLCDVALMQNATLMDD